MSNMQRRAMTDLMDINISQQEHEEFARISGDFNPIHCDPVKARRMPALSGRPILHGMHLVLHCLDVLAESLGDRQIARLKARFMSPGLSRRYGQASCNAR